ncbi:MAG TPA: DNA gyrase inhibitor YacG [Candidatus Binatia bacterium]|nr:DNA gyrase inhibitor YacG [Candidatus Binatia bacterium]
MVRTVKCPTCRTPVSWQGNPHRPFCSARCRTIDLGSWADESYRIAGEQTNQEEPTKETATPETKA